MCKKKTVNQLNHNQKKRDAQQNRIKNNFRKKYNDNGIERYIRTYIVDFKNINFALKIELNESNIKKKNRILND